MAEAEKKLRVPPNSKESEMMVLGCMLTSINGMNAAADSLEDLDFYYTEHQTVFSTLKEAYRADKPADIHLIAEELKRKGKLDGVGGVSYLTTLAQYAGTSAFIEEYVNLVKEKAIWRRMIQASQMIEKTALEEASNVHVALDEAQKQFFQISQSHQTSSYVVIKDLISGLKAESKLPYLKELEEKQQRYKEKGPDDTGITGIPTHFVDLDKLLNGLNPSNLMILAARPSMGKCVTGDTLILDPETGSLLAIQDLVKQRSGNVVTLGKDWKLHKTKPAAYIPDGVKPTFKVTTALGREIEATAVHPLLTILGWKQLEELKVGDRIAVPRSLPFFGKKEWPQHKLKMLAYLLADGNLTNLSPRFTNNNPKIVEDFTKAAHSFGPIHIRKDDPIDRTPTYAISLDRTPLQNLKDRFSKSLQTLSRARKQIAYQTIEQLGFSKSLVYQWAHAGALPSYASALALEEQLPELPSLREAVRENPVTEFLEELGLMGKNSHQKFFPSSIFELSQENLSVFISRLFSCDGTAYVANCGGRPFPVIAYSSVSKTLIYQLQHLLLRFGILSKIRQKKTSLNEKIFSSFELEIHGKEDLIRFCQEIGIYGKEEAVQSVLRTCENIQAGWSKDTLPIQIWDLIRAKKGKRSWASLFRNKGLPAPSNLHEGKRSIRRDTLTKLGSVLEDEELLQLANSDVYWDRIVSIEATGEKEVFDLSVDTTHNFVAGDIIVHNTAIALNIAENICFRNKTPVGFFSLEMSASQLLHRVICSQSEVESEKILTGSLNGSDYQRVVAAVKSMEKHVMVIDDQPGLKISDIRVRARRMKEAYNIGFLVIDYLQLISGSGNTRSIENRQVEISEISRTLKTLARELNIPILCAAQLSRKVEERQGHRPMMSDLRESGCLAADTLIQDADTGRIYTIKELAERSEQTPIRVLAMDESLKVSPHYMTKAFFSGKKKIYELKMKSGRTIKASANHPFYHFSGWTRLDALKAGDQLAMPRIVASHASSSVLRQDELSLLAHLLGDGSILPRQPYRYASADADNLSTVSTAARNLFGINTISTLAGNCYTLRLPSPYHLTHGKVHPITTWFQNLGISRVRSYDKQIPAAVLASPESDRLFFPASSLGN